MSDTYRYRWGPKVWRNVKKTGTVDVEIGDMIKHTSSGKCTPVSASSDAVNLLGVAMTASPTTDATNTTIRLLEVGHGTTFEMGVSSGAYNLGDAFVISGEQTLVKKSVSNPVNTSTNIVAQCVEDTDTATTVLVEFGPCRLTVPVSAS